jgi:chromosome segregation ATPase
MTASVPTTAITADDDDPEDAAVAALDRLSAVDAAMRTLAASLRTVVSQRDALDEQLGTYAQTSDTHAAELAERLSLSLAECAALTQTVRVVTAERNHLAVTAAAARQTQPAEQEAGNAPSPTRREHAAVLMTAQRAQQQAQALTLSLQLAHRECDTLSRNMRAMTAQRNDVAHSLGAARERIDALEAQLEEHTQLVARLAHVIAQRDALRTRALAAETRASTAIASMDAARATAAAGVARGRGAASTATNTSAASAHD